MRFRIGTAGFIAPEILQNKPYGLPVDIWSLGCVLFAMITSEPPLWDDDTMIRGRKVCFEELDLESCRLGFMPDVSPECKDLILGLLHKDPARRLKIDQVLKHPWFYS